MQNKGFVIFVAIMLTLICCFYLSFSVVTNSYESEAAEIAQKDSAKAQAYLDSLNTHPCYFFGFYNLKECRETGVGLGLDLKGGMNAILEVSVSEVVKTLADHKTDPAFLKSVDEAKKEADESQSDFISLFVKAYKKNAPNSTLASIFATQQLKDKVNSNSTDKEVEEVLRTAVEDAVNNSFNVLRTRIDRFGVVQPNIQKIEGQVGRIMVELPGIKEPERVSKLLEGSANLEFYETYDASEIAPLLNQLNTILENGDIEEETASVDTTNVETAAADSTDTTAVKLTATTTPKKALGEDAAKKVNTLRILNFGNYGGCQVGMAVARDTAEINRLLATPEAKQILPSDLSLKWGAQPARGRENLFTLYAIKVGKGGRAPLEGDCVVEAKDGFIDQTNTPCVSITMNADGSRTWADMTDRNVGHAVAIVLDNLVYSAPNVNERIEGGRTQISGSFTTTATKDLANVLASGRMPAPATIVQSDVVGPTLGAQSIKAGFISCIIAFLLLMTYMIAMYGFKAGMVANAALILNFFFSFGILASFGAALTLSGLAGMVLTLGMAVDANVLIFERTKEELRSGKNMKNAVDAGYSNAFSAIFDSNVTTILTGIILYNFGTGPIKGFATTLMIGIICSFFTAVWLTRIVFEHFVNNGKWQNLTFTTPLSKNLMQNTKYNFMGSYKKSFIVFGVLVAICAASLAIRQLSPSIDFTGGRNYKVEFVKSVQPEAVEKAIEAKFNAANPEEKANVTVIAIGTDGKQVRVSTNYRIKESGSDVDSEIENNLYESFVEAGFIDNNVTLDQFLNRDDRAGGSIISSQKVGPSIAEDITYGAILSVLFAIVAIFIYILIRFRNVAYSVGSIGALCVDTFLVIGAFSLCYGWMPFSLEIDQTFIGAILTVIGYSINDKVVVFDRIREAFKVHPKRDRQRNFNESLNACLARTINTSVSTFVVLLAIIIFGADSIRGFAFAMILGVVIGTFSSIFIAAPIAYLVMGARIKEEDEVEVEPAK